MMFLVRDDDANATTDPARLERAYAPLLDAGVPVCFSTVPEVALDTRAPDGERERFIDERSPSCDAHVRLTEDTPLARWLRAHAHDVDVFAHGLSHRRLRGGTEFGALTHAEARTRVAEANAIFVRAIGRAPLGFVAPWDALSAGSLRACVDAYPLVSTGWVAPRLLPVGAWPAHVLERIGRREALRVRRSWVVRHRGGRLAEDTPPDAVPRILDELARRADVAVVVLHHWMYWDRADPHPAIVALANALRTRPVCDVRRAIAHLDARPLWQTRAA